MARFAVAVDVSGRITVEVDAEDSNDAQMKAIEKVRRRLSQPGASSEFPLHLDTSYGDAVDQIGD